MAVGDVISGIGSVAINGVLDIRPAPGVEWSVHNVYWNQGTVELYVTNGIHLLKFEGDGSPGGRLGANFNCTNTQWVQVKNTALSATIVAYDGKETK